MYPQNGWPSSKERRSWSLSDGKSPCPQAEGEDPGAGEAQEPQPDSGNGSMDELD